MPADAPFLDAPFPDAPFPDAAGDARLTEGVITRRVFAYLVDLLLIGCAMGLFWLMVLPIGLLTLGLGFHLLVVWPLIPPFYHFAFLSWRGATPGQRLLDITERRNRDLGTPGAGQAALATAGLYLTWALGGLWFLVALLTQRRRALHDIAAGLVVVRESSLTRPSPPWTMGPGFRTHDL